MELLAPAKNAECGIAAVNHGADAVYIGAPKFSARAGAGNSLQEIERLIQHAHRYNARVYAALNTILKDSELTEAEQIIRQLYEIGADALIVQDMGILELNLPPIPLHASTQTDNRTVEKVQFLEQAGFAQVVLARELSLAQIREISSKTNVALEFFVHGALCVSYSGQCYISQALAGRSANRGECAQYCRLPYDLLDGNGKIIAQNKHFLSLKDLNLSDHLADLLDAGVSSFKIEGRLKDMPYVKNITAFYRQKLDALFETDKRYTRSSSGKTRFFFTPNPEKTFQRGATTYFLNGRDAHLSSHDTPKSISERIGKVSFVGQNYFGSNSATLIHNGDGLVFFNAGNELEGFRVNKVENGKIFPAQKINLSKGTTIYRNSDVEFEKQLAGKSAERRVAVDIVLSEIENGFALTFTDEDGNSVSENFPCQKELATRPDAGQNILQQLGKLGNTYFEARNIKIDTPQTPFIPSSSLANWRRTLCELLEKERITNYPRQLVETRRTTSLQYPKSELSYLENVYNSKARNFYTQHGATVIEP
ncbi:MAG: U32 family peptidase, partial [Prevotellaceae bacterium]|nr:U32 family peptidase [Prevotellaceae bacterium]